MSSVAIQGDLMPATSRYFMLHGPCRRRLPGPCNIKTIVSRAAASSQESRPESLLAPKNNTCRQRVRCTKVVGTDGAIYQTRLRLSSRQSAFFCEKILVIQQANCYNRGMD